MLAAERFATHPTGRLESHPVHGEIDPADPHTFRLHVEFVHAHGVPRGEFTTFSTCSAASTLGGPSGRGGARAQ